MKQKANSTNDRPNQILTFSTATTVCEGWNNKFHSLVGHSHPTIWKLIETLQVKANRIASILLQSDRGIHQKKRTKRIHTELQTRQKNMCKDYKQENPLQNFYLELASTLEVANIFVRSDHLCICSQFILVCK